VAKFFSFIDGMNIGWAYPIREYDLIFEKGMVVKSSP